MNWPARAALQKQTTKRRKLTEIAPYGTSLVSEKKAFIPLKKIEIIVLGRADHTAPLSALGSFCLVWNIESCRDLTPPPLPRPSNIQKTASGQLICSTYHLCCFGFCPPECLAVDATLPNAKTQQLF